MLWFCQTIDTDIDIDTNIDRYIDENYGGSDNDDKYENTNGRFVVFFSVLYRSAWVIFVCCMYNDSWIRNIGC